MRGLPVRLEAAAHAKVAPPDHPMFAAAVDRNTQKPRLGQLLVRAGVLDTGSLAKALVEHERGGRPLGMTLVELGFVSEQVLVSTLGHQLGIPIARIASWPVSSELRELVPAQIAEKYRCLPLALKDEGTRQSLYLAMADPSDLECLEAVRIATGREIRIVLVAPTEMDAALARHYRGVETELPASRPGEKTPERTPDDPEFLHRWSVSRDELLSLLALDPATLKGVAPSLAPRAERPDAAAASGPAVPVVPIAPIAPIAPPARWAQSAQW
ncbi:MAG: hypothetical protein E4H11_02225, partial [Myxococcales bacterium]